jgi:ketosteroid isomerase-like protein
MTIELQPVLQAFVNAQNTHDTDALLECFTGDALVHDEGRDYQGADAIRAWSDDINERYNLTMEVLGVVEQEQETRLTSLVSGNFDGSPAELTYFLTLRDGKIAEFRA